MTASMAFKNRPRIGVSASPNKKDKDGDGDDQSEKSSGLTTAI